MRSMCLSRPKFHFDTFQHFPQDNHLLAGAQLPYAASIVECSCCCLILPDLPRRAGQDFKPRHHVS